MVFFCFNLKYNKKEVSSIKKIFSFALNKYLIVLYVMGFGLGIGLSRVYLNYFDLIEMGFKYVNR